MSETYAHSSKLPILFCFVALTTSYKTTNDGQNVLDALSAYRLCYFNQSPRCPILSGTHQCGAYFTRYSRKNSGMACSYVSLLPIFSEYSTHGYPRGGSGGGAGRYPNGRSGGRNTPHYRSAEYLDSNGGADDRDMRLVVRGGVYEVRSIDMHT